MVEPTGHGKVKFQHTGDGVQFGGQGTCAKGIEREEGSDDGEVSTTKNHGGQWTIVHDTTSGSQRRTVKPMQFKIRPRGRKVAI